MKNQVWLEEVQFQTPMINAQWVKKGEETIGDAGVEPVTAEVLREAVV